MPLFRPSELINYLREQGLYAKKGLSQNFLIDGNILRKIIQAADLQPGDRVLEIGPGPGALTEQILAAGANVIAVEKDSGFAEIMPDWIRRSDPEAVERLQVVNADIMDFPIDEYFSPDGQRTKVIANLPYHLTTPIIAMLVKRPDLFSSLTVMVQDEVARRFVSKAGSKDYSSFTVFLEYYCGTVRYAFKVGRRCFFPAPKVDSAIVHLCPHVPREDVPEEAFFGMVRQAFQQRRKMLRKSLQPKYSAQATEQALESIDLVPTARPEQLSLEKWIALFQRLLD